MDDRTKIKEWLLSAPVTIRQIFILKFHENFTDTEIASTLDLEEREVQHMTKWAKDGLALVMK